jgi:hypothetical protein
MPATLLISVSSPRAALVQPWSTSIGLIIGEPSASPSLNAEHDGQPGEHSGLGEQAAVVGEQQARTRAPSRRPSPGAECAAVRRSARPARCTATSSKLIPARPAFQPSRSMTSSRPLPLTIMPTL